MGFIEGILRKQTRFELKAAYFVFWKIKTSFLFGLIALSLISYAVLVAIYFTLFEFEGNENIFNTGQIPAFLNPITIFFVSLCIIIITIWHDRK